MKPSVLFLLVLPALSSTSLQESSQHKSVSILELAPKDRTPDIPSNITMQTPRLLLSSPTLRRRRQAQRSTLFDGSPNLKWVKWSGHLPDGSFSIYNEYEDRVDYVCKYKCDAGFYTPSKGHYCHFPFFNKEYRATQFEILVNKDDFEILEWKDGSYGSVPPHSVKTCSHEDLYVAKNKYGLGTVHVRHGAFFLPWEGSEYFYKTYYQVLTFRKDVYSEQISDVRYNTGGGQVFKYPPESMFSISVINHECDSVEQTPTVKINIKMAKRWDFSSSTRFGFKTSFSGGVPILASGTIEISGDQSLTVSRGQTETKEISNSIPLKVSVPPNHYCKVVMVVYKYKADISFTARLTRIYRDDRTTSMYISGTYNGVDFAEAIGVVDRCEPVPNARPCPQRTP